MTTSPPTQPRRKRLLHNLMLLLVLVVLAAVLLVMFALHRPAFYDRALRRDPDRLARDAYDFSRKTQDFVSAVWSEKAFPLELTEDEVNGYLAAAGDDRLWDRLPLKFESWRKVFADTPLRHVRVSFQAGRVIVAGEATYVGVDLAVSLSGVPHIDRDGKLRFNVRSVSAGALPVPQFLTGDLLRDIHNRPLHVGSRRWRLTSVDIKEGKAILLGEPTPRED